MKKTAILLAFMLVVISVTFGTTGCTGKGSSEATEAPTATPIATVAPTAPATKAPQTHSTLFFPLFRSFEATAPATKAPTTPVATQPTVPATQAPTQPATFEAQIATGATLPSSVPTATEEGSSSPERPTASSNASSSLGAPDANGNYSVTGSVVGYGPNTVIVVLRDGNQYEFNYNGTGVESSDLYDGASVSIVADGDPSGAGVPNALSLTIN